MNSYNTKRKFNPISLLLFLLGVGYFSILLVNNVKTATPVIASNNDIAAASSNILAVNTDLEPVALNNEYEIISNLGEDQVSEVYSSGDVLGCDGIGGTGCPFTNSIKFQPLCFSDAVKFDYSAFVGSASDNRRIRKDSEIKIHRITAPEALFAGSEYWENDRREISNEFPVFPSNNNFISTESGTGMARSFCTPGVDCEDFDGIIEGAPMGTFAVNAKLALDGEKVGDQRNDKAVIEKTLRSACDDVNDSDMNPARTNYLANILEDIGQLPGEHPSTRKNSGGCIEESQIQVNGDSSDVFVACVAERKPFQSITSGFFSFIEQILCTIGDEEGDTDPCMDTNGFVIMIDSIFGSTKECNEFDCANRYLDALQAGSSLPGDASAMVPDGVDADFNNSYTKPIFMSTPCQVIADDKIVVNTICLWDITNIREWYDRQAKVSLPGEEDFPVSFEDYFEKVMYDVDRRGGRCTV